MVTPNQLTVLRIILAIICPTLLLLNRSFTNELIVFVLFTIACFTDWWDGYLARKYNLITNLGKIADPIADKLMTLGLMFTFAHLEFYGYEWVIVIFVRETVVTIARMIKLKKGEVIPAEKLGKIKVGFQIGSIYATLLYAILFDSGLFWHPEPYFLFAFNSLHYLGIFLAVIFTVISGIQFFQHHDE